ncbi:MAG: acyltransferase [Silicimonas sp.]|nr:acyltransferase [Silicimonas sp.]
MTDATPTEMPKGMMARARWAAENTPASRNRAVDLYRAIAITFVILGHWLLVAPVIRGGEVELTILLAEQTWTQYATWLFQVMPIFFFVGGYANGLSWNSARKDPARARVWASGRLSRLLKPTMPLVLVWAASALVANRMGVSPELIAAASQAALVPIWFLAVYIMITMVVPLSYALWDRIGFLSVILLGLGSVAVDFIAFSFDQGWLRWSNYGFVWLTVHQLGYWWQRAERPKTFAAGFIALGLTALYILLARLGYPISMVSVPGEEVSNTLPPTVAMLAVGMMQVGVVLLLEGPAKRWLESARPWSWVIVINQMIMSIYLWHMTAMIAVVGLIVTLMGGFGLSVEPGTGFWWAMRPIWVAIYAAALVPFVLIFMSFESASRAKGDAVPGPAQSMVGALLTCSGLVMMALDGLGATTALGVNWIAVLLVAIGVFLATRSLAPGKL